MTQGALPLIGYNVPSGNKARMMAAVKGLFFDCLFVSLAGTALLFFGAKPITACFIDNARTVSYGCAFLRIICLACTTTSLNFFAITVFQATGKHQEPIFLSLLRKGTLDVALMFLFYRLMGVVGVAWATPAADAAALLISTALLLPYLKKLKKEQALAA